jgi:Protein of unknown function (DUF1214)
MAYGDHPEDEALSSAWKQFCRSLEEAGERVFKQHNPATTLHRADGFRFLTQNLGQAFDLALETKNTQFPVIHSFCSPFRKLGGDNADYTYQQAWIDGHAQYRISGNIGTCKFFNIAVQGARPVPKPGMRGLHDPFGDTPQANLFGHDMAVGWDGSFEVYIGGEKPDPKLCPNWLPTTPDTRKLFIRQGFDDWAELPVTMRIERVGMNEPRPMPDSAEMKTAIEWASTFVSQLMIDWPDWSYEFSEDFDPDGDNSFATARRRNDDPVYNPELDKVRGRAITSMRWRLAPDEALIVEWDKDDRFWMLTNMGTFMNSMDYLYRPVSYSPARTKADSDSKYRVILAHSDPGFHNWMDTQGFEVGHLGARVNFSSEGNNFTTTVVKHAELEKHLPADSARVTPEERSAMMLQRYYSILRRYNS